MAEEYKESPDLSPEGHDDGDNTIGRISTPMEDDSALAASNGHHPQGDAATEDDDFSYEEQLNFAGVDPDDDGELVTTEDLLEGPSSAKSRGAENSPLTRTGLVAAGLGGLVFIIWALSSLFGGSEQVAEDPQDPLPQEGDAALFDEGDAYRAQLALVEQQEAQEAQPQAAQVEPNPNAEQEPAEEPAEPQPQVVRAQPTPPPPAPPRAAPTPPPPAPATQPPPPLPPVEDVDPLEQWAQLSRAGATGEEVALVPEPEIINGPGSGSTGSTGSTTSSNNPTPAAANPLPTDTIGDDPISTSPTAPRDRQTVATRQRGDLVASTPGAQGILTRRPASELEPSTSPSGRYQVAIGTSAPGRVVVPMVYAGNQNPNNSRFAVELTAPLVDVNGQVALAAGTILITQLSGAPESRVIRQQVIAIVHKDASGQVRQETVAPGVLVIRGQNNQPLVADVVDGNRGSNFGQDLLVSGLSALSNVGRTLLAPDSVTTATSGSSGGISTTSTSTTVTSGDDNIWAAVVDGFFTPVSERVGERIDQNQDSAVPYLVVNEGRDVSIFVNGFLEVVR
jgi:hypothetical protein